MFDSSRLPASAVEAPASDDAVFRFLPYRDSESRGRLLREQLMAEADALFGQMDWTVTA